MKKAIFTMGLFFNSIIFVHAREADLNHGRQQAVPQDELRQGELRRFPRFVVPRAQDWVNLTPEQRRVLIAEAVRRAREAAQRGR